MDRYLLSNYYPVPMPLKYKRMRMILVYKQIVSEHRRTQSKFQSESGPEAVKEMTKRTQDGEISIL